MKEDKEDSFVIIHALKLKTIFLEAKNKKKTILPYAPFASVFLTLIISLLSTNTYNDFLFVKGEQFQVVIIIFAALCLFAIIGIAVYKHMATKKKEVFDYDLDKIEQEIIDSSSNKQKKNLILLFVQKENNKIKFLVKRKETWNHSYFFPYIEDNYSSDISDDLTDIKRKIKNSFSINASILITLRHLTKLDMRSVKVNPFGIPQHHTFRFIYITSSSPFFYNLINKELQGGSNAFEFKDVDFLLSDKTTFEKNGDVVEILKSNIDNILDIHNQNSQHKTSKIIWNIDKKCNNQCSFCAYGAQDKNKELELSDKKKVIDSLKDLYINDIDFSVGNNPNIDHLKQTIIYTKKKYPHVRISLTATNEVLTALLTENDFIKKNISCIDISYDCPHNLNDANRPRFFNEDNYKIAKELTNKKYAVKIHTVINADTNAKSIRSIRQNLNKINISDILLIRLMPVGNQTISDYPKQLLNATFYQNLMTDLSTVKGIKYHCSLLGLKDKSSKSPCELGCNKLGISDSGDIYVCPWAEHLNDEDNPFLIGNVLEEENLKDLLLQSDLYKNIIEKKNNNQPHCKIFAHVLAKNMFYKEDILYK